MEFFPMFAIKNLKKFVASLVVGLGLTAGAGGVFASEPADEPVAPIEVSEGNSIVYGPYNYYSTALVVAQRADNLNLSWRIFTVNGFFYVQVW
jgi:hypothetical protein